jgi:hypothetical protein
MGSAAMSDPSPASGTRSISERTRVNMPLIAMITGIIAICGAAGGTALIYAKISYSVMMLTADKDALRSEMHQSAEQLRQDVRDLQAVVMGNHYLDNPIIRGRTVTRGNNPITDPPTINVTP